jgi:hypothetical protein
LFLFFAVLGKKPRTVYMLDKSSTSELYPQPTCILNLMVKERPHIVYCDQAAASFSSLILF